MRAATAAVTVVREGPKMAAAELKRERSQACQLMEARRELELRVGLTCLVSSTLREIDLVRGIAQHLERPTESKPPIDTNPIGRKCSEQYEHAAHAGKCKTLARVVAVACSEDALSPQTSALTGVPVEPRTWWLDEIKLGRLSRLAQTLRV